MDIDYLFTFQTVLEKGSFSKAAKVLGLSQPAVSFQIHSLEKLFGENFFIRGGTGIQLTQAGEIFSSYAREILKLNSQLANSMADLSEKVSGPLKIGASSIPGNYIVPGLLGEFIKHFPQVRPILQIEDTAKIIDLLLAREIDFGFIGFPTTAKVLNVIPFVEDEILIVAAPGVIEKKDGMMKKSDLVKTPFILREEGSGTRSSLEKALHGSGLSIKELNVVLEVGGNEAALNAAESGLGLTAISRWAAKKSIDLGTARGYTVRGLDLKRKLFFCFHGKTKFLKSAEIFKSFVYDKASSLNGK